MLSHARCRAPRPCHRAHPLGRRLKGFEARVRCTQNNFDPRPTAQRSRLALNGSAIFARSITPSATARVLPPAHAAQHQIRAVSLEVRVLLPFTSASSLVCPGFPAHGRRRMSLGRVLRFGFLSSQWTGTLSLGICRLFDWHRVFNLHSPARWSGSRGWWRVRRRATKLVLELLGEVLQETITARARNFYWFQDPLAARPWTSSVRSPTRGHTCCLAWPQGLVGIATVLAILDSAVDAADHMVEAGAA